MPEISRFFGISIRMYHDEHNPPHFHAIYGNDEAVFGIQPLAVLYGKVSGRTIALVMEWAAMHQDELMDNWNRMRDEQAPKRVKPLE